MTLYSPNNNNNNNNNNCKIKNRSNSNNNIILSKNLIENNILCPIKQKNRPRVHSIHLDHIELKKIQGPWISQQFLKLFKEKLTLYEQKEILNYSEIYFAGNNLNNKIKSSFSLSPNEGFDNEKGDYKIILNDHIDYRYEIIGILGKGAFGEVLDHKTNKYVALKIIKNKQRYYQQALIEIKILDYIKKKDNQNRCHIVQMLDSFNFRNHYCITFELLSINLYEFIKANQFKGFNLNLIKKISIQLLTALRFLSKHHIIHCDLKPENILLRELTKLEITLVDFGSSCFEHEKVYNYIQSRFYRSPEIILGIPYSCSIDMWSFGCILCELYTGFPLFAGENEFDQLACIIEILGLPPNKILEQSSRKKYFFTSNGKPRIIENSKRIKRIPGSKSLTSIIETTDTLFLDFISQCLKWNPKERLTPSAALSHRWILKEEETSTIRRSSKSISQELLPRPHAPLPNDTPDYNFISIPDINLESSSTLNIPKITFENKLQNYKYEENNENNEIQNDNKYYKYQTNNQIDNDLKQNIEINENQNNENQQCIISQSFISTPELLDYTSNLDLSNYSLLSLAN
jgi:dual specificity tyrosine-phosphorylation-regulated kinase 2/3/4